MKKNKEIKKFIYKLQAFGLKILIKLFLFIGLKISTFISGFLLVIFGIFTPPSFLAMKNIKKAMPELNFFQRFRIILGMWNNLGRSLAEFVSFNIGNSVKLVDYITIDEESNKNLLKIKNSLNGEIIFTAHFANWEILSQVFMLYDFPLSAIYRAMNNEYADKIVLKYREKNNIEMIPKGQKGVIKLARSLKGGRKILMLVDQRLGNGIEVPFFNIPAKTSDAIATFALKYNYKIYSVVVFRKSFSSYFDIKVGEFDIIKTGNLKEDIKMTTKKINETIEGWIKTKPEQWFWVHNRWKE